jgi:thymidylate synthase
MPGFRHATPWPSPSSAPASDVNLIARIAGLIHGESISQIYPVVLRQILEQGAGVAPRGLPTIEALGCQIQLERPRARVLHATGRIINPAFAVAEATWILSGSDEPWIYQYNNSLRAYADDGVLRGAYGPRLRRWGGRIDQLDNVRRLLLREPESRQAVVQLFDPSRDWSGFRDVPCTIGHRFFIRDGLLHMHSSMRSQDAWLGLPYDIFANTVLQELLAGWLEVSVGRYVHSVDSLHLYKDDVNGAAEVVMAGADSAGDVEDVDLSLPFDLMDATLAATISGEQSCLSPGWAVYASVLKSYRDWRNGRREEAMIALDSMSDPLRSALRRWYAHLSTKTSHA